MGLTWLDLGLICFTLIFYLNLLALVVFSDIISSKWVRRAAANMRLSVDVVGDS